MAGRGALSTVGLTLGALVAFAANSVLCRLALGPASIDPAAFTALRLAAGAITLWAIAVALGHRRPVGVSGTWTSTVMLFVYAAAFSFAYVKLTAGVGALVLFGAVQATMILSGLRSGERPHPMQWMGITVAIVGLVVLVRPGIQAPPTSGSLLMAMAGIAWGIYSLRGRTAVDPMAATTDHFVRSLPLVAALALIRLPTLHTSTRGTILAIVSGAITSGLGYVVWYAALPAMTATRAAVVQLTVPVLAALGGVIFLAEEPTLRLLVAAMLILGGVALAAVGRGQMIRNLIEHEERSSTWSDRR